MAKSFPKNFAWYVKVNKEWLLAIGVSAVLWRLGTYIFAYDDLLIKESVLDSRTLNLFFFPAFLLNLVFSVGVGLSFKRGKREEWVSKFPEAGGAVLAFPYLLFAVFSGFLFLLNPACWNVLSDSSGLPRTYFFLVLPTVSFLFTRGIRSTILGVFLSTMVTGVLVLIPGHFAKGFELELYALNAAGMRMAYEMAGLGIVLLSLLFLGGRRAKFSMVILSSVALVLLFCLVNGFRLERDLDSLKNYLEPADKVFNSATTADLECKKVSKYLESRDGVLFSASSEVKVALGHLRSFPILLDENKLVFPYSNEFSAYSSGAQNAEDLASAIVSFKLMSVRRCSPLLLLDIAKKLIASFQLDLTSLSEADRVEIKTELLNIVKRTAENGSTLLGYLVDGHILEQMSKNHLISKDFEEPIRAFQDQLQKTREEVRPLPYCHDMKRIASVECVRANISSLKKELKAVAAQRAPLIDLISEIVESTSR